MSDREDLLKQIRAAAVDREVVAELEAEYWRTEVRRAQIQQRLALIKLEAQVEKLRRTLGEL